MKATIRTKNAGTFCDVELKSVMEYSIAFDVMKKQTTAEQICDVMEYGKANITDYTDRIHICIAKKYVKDVIISEL